MGHMAKHFIEVEVESLPPSRLLLTAELPVQSAPHMSQLVVHTHRLKKEVKGLGEKVKE